MHDTERKIPRTSQIQQEEISEKIIEQEEVSFTAHAILCVLGS
jgi:hypothetical protein